MDACGAMCCLVPGSRKNCCERNPEKNRGDRLKTVKTLRQDAKAIFQAGISAVDALKCVQRYLIRDGEVLRIGEKDYDLAQVENIFVIGAGKATASMAKAVQTVLGDRITDGCINVKYDHVLPLDIIRLHEAGHPLPDMAGIEGSRQIKSLLERSGKNDLVLCLLSGGGSALLPFPAKGLTLEQIQQLTQQLLHIGATIQEINILRKHVSQVKGGRLACLAHPSPLVTLILSDVIGDDLASIASGPTVPDPSTFQDCLDILDRYSLISKIPAPLLAFLQAGARGEKEETPKPDNPVFQKTHNVIIASNLTALKAALNRAKELGYNTLLLSSSIMGETREVAKVHAAIAEEIQYSGLPVSKPACVISGGETTVTVSGQGLGGRNQEFVLAAALQIKDMNNAVVLSAGTDGTDGPTDAAGAIADGATIQRAQALGLEASQFLQDNDSYHFFQPLGDLLMTGPTLTNVMDLRLVMVGLMDIKKDIYTK